MREMLDEDELRELDPLSELIIEGEQSRQQDKLILIPSESICPQPVRRALGSAFVSIYAEGYPSAAMCEEPEDSLADLPYQLAHVRRYKDRRFYQGCEYVNIVEALARRRVAELFARDACDGGPSVPPEAIFANVQPMSGAAANNAVYEALLRPGDVIMGMELSHGGHLTHGSPLNRSGKYHEAVAYGVNPETGRLDYDQLEELARRTRPRLIIAGATAYPWEIDWRRLGQVADAVPGRALLVADIAHPAGLVVAGLFPNPVGYADVITFTTHKTLLGPRGAVILTTDQELAARIDRAVFPGEQGGPHINKIAAMAVCFQLARTEEFQHTQARIVQNAQALAQGLRRRGLSLVGGGTNTHLLLVDLKPLRPAGHIPLMGDPAARILDVCGLVCNKNTIPGDADASVATGLRFGTVWLTQRGMGPEEMDQIADLVHQVLTHIRPFTYAGTQGDLYRGRLPLELMQQVRQALRDLAQRFPAPERAAHEPVTVNPHARPSSRSAAVLQVRGARAPFFLQAVCSSDVLSLGEGEGQDTLLTDSEGTTLARARVQRLAQDRSGRDRYLLCLADGQVAHLRARLEALSDGYVLFDEDIRRKVDGPVVIEEAELDAASAPPAPAAADGLVAAWKPYFIGQHALRAQAEPGPPLPPFQWLPPQQQPRPSCLYEEHLKHTARRHLVPFAGWLMPVLFSSIAAEHRAVRQAAALFDVSHMGVIEIAGPGACRLLDLVFTEYVPAIKVGQARYGYLLDPDARVVDDVFLFCRGLGRYMMVANAVNAEKVKAWLEAVASGHCLIDRDRPDVRPDATATVRDLKDPACGEEMRVDLALQGPASLAVLEQVIADPALRARVRRLRQSEFVQGRVAGLDLIISRTGYTGEPVGYELYVHPERAPELWNLLLEAGALHGLLPAGLGARDSTRNEAGLPLWRHELAGPLEISPAEAGYGAFVKLHKPFFVGRGPYMQRLAESTRQVVRFRMLERGIPVVRPGNPVVDGRGQCVGAVTSCVVVEGQQVGMACVEARLAEPGTPLGIFVLPSGRALPPEKAKDALAAGDRVLLHYRAEVLPRFLAKADTELPAMSRRREPG